MGADPGFTRWMPLVEARARRLSGVGGAEYDDLVQEGSIRAWQLTGDGHIPTERLIDRALVDYIRAWSNRGKNG